MRYIDLVNLLQRYNRELKNVEVYGIISSRLNRPMNLDDSLKYSKTGIFVKVDVFAVNLSYYAEYLKSMGIASKDGIYMVNGSLVTFIEPQGKVLPDWYAMRGTLRFGDRQSTDFVSLYKFKKDGKSWVLDDTDLYDFEITGVSKDPELSPVLQNCINHNAIVYPKCVENLPKFYHFPRERMLRNTIQTQQKMQEHQKMVNQTIRGSANSELMSMNELTKGDAPPSTQINTNQLGGMQLDTNGRKEVEDYSDIVRELQHELDDSEASRVEYIKSLKNEYKIEEGLNEHIVYMIANIMEYLTRKPDTFAFTGRKILDTYLKKFELYDYQYMGNMTVGKYVVTNFSDVVKCLMSDDSRLMMNGKALSLATTALLDVERFYAGVLSVITGVSFDELDTIQSLCTRNGISFSKLVNGDTYALQLLSSLPYNKIERIALCLGNHDKSELSKSRNIALLFSSLNDASDSSTFINKNDIRGAKVGLTLTKAEYAKCREVGSTLTDTVLSNIKYYLRAYKSKPSYELSSFRLYGMNYIRPLSTTELAEAIKDLVDSGMGVEYGRFITSYNLLDKELYIYTKLHKLASIKVKSYDGSKVDKYIEEYEKEVGFKLEERQREAVHLLVNSAGVVAGSAGSGKTTTIKCFVYVLERLEGEYFNIKFCTPTAKAAKRMQEVIQREVTTANSLFKMGFSNVDTIFDDEEDNGYSMDCLIMDESGMFNIHTFYKIIRAIGDNTRLYLFGDIHQLPPIGKGLPFKNLLSFLPCVFLNVSKRASEGSNITLNSDLINNNSSRNNWKNLVSGKDCLICPCNEEYIKEFTKILCKYYLGTATVQEVDIIKKRLNLTELPMIDGITPDDIQVVSPLVKPSYSWGSTQLNSCLQPIFNKNKGYKNTIIHMTSKDSYRKFMIGDRVIHTESNMYGMQWYSSYKNGVFQKKWGSGICNGEVGKIVAFYPTESCEFFDEVDEKPDGFDYPESLRHDDKYSENGSYFVVVEYYDYLSEENFYILYRCVEFFSAEHNSEGKCLSGDDIKKLNLFYAGNVHKLQGSQSKIVIGVLGSVNYDGFITRNMVYTLTTRAEKLLILLGSVGNEPSSMLSRARKDCADSKAIILGDVLNL